MESKAFVPNGGYPMHTFDDLRESYFPYIRNEKDRKMIEDAFLLAKEKHGNQFRKSGEPYIQHPIEVAYICASLQAGPATLAAALLHDVVEDTDVTIEEIEERFGKDVAKIVGALTKIQRMKLSHMTAEDFEAEDHRKIFLGMAQDVRVIIVKLADRLHNMRTLDSLSKERQAALSKETIEVFTPIAHRLGIYTVQSELEDLSLKYLEPEKYRHITNLVNERFSRKKQSLESFKKRLADILFEQKIPFRMESRVKSIYSIYRKMYKKDKNFDDIYDILAIRIITKTTLNCYEALGIIHSTYKPIPGRFKDYIAMPKPNMYQSLHTSVLSGDGNSFEVQIRTEEMDQIAETGVAAHWRYKEGDYNQAAEQKDIENNLAWFRDFVSLSDENSSASAHEYLSSLTSDIFGANVYVFTPMGRVIDLPAGSTTLDFAYKIHTKVGDSAVGAVVNGVGVSLATVLKTGDVCEIRTSKTASPNDSWLEIAKTSSAKSHIRRALQKKQEAFMREEKIRQGKTNLMDAFRASGIEEEAAMRYLEDPRIENEFHFPTIEDLLIGVSARNPTPSAIMDVLGIRKKPKPVDLVRKSPSKPKESDGSPVEVAGGVQGLAISLAHCCAPIPGDDIVGYITKGKGITVHRANCPNVSKGERLVSVYWKEDLGISRYPVDIEILANDRPSLIADILQCLGAKSVGCNDLKAHLVSETMNVVVDMTVSVPDAKVLQDCFADLLGTKGIFEVRRIIH
ncbi:MAG: bifunctional (p)ppGpp synthetase/guanosine-3',5'-bis(diphosphate) 3'-pyrophosphohydrolase [Candidatus Enteromonas sp.]|nr:bifunctional (p)ppGpp synthetase/guanosine-3',5'-bis(diphosphate) 3'-pyrophosphohydrolase [Candidatus Enteromonas sp.]